jgi:hypothetical protein
MIQLIPPSRTVLERGADVTAGRALNWPSQWYLPYFDIAITMARNPSGGEDAYVSMYDILLKSL